jgi:hypothetical protein
VFILKRVKVICFDTLLQVLILKGFTLHQNFAKSGLPTLKRFKLFRMSISISVDSKWVTDKVSLRKNTSAGCLGIIKPGGGQKVRFAPDPVPEMFPDKVGAGGTGRSRGVNIDGVRRTAWQGHMFRKARRDRADFTKPL